MNITLLEGTTKYPLQKIGYMAGVCWNANTSNVEKNIERAKDCLESGHGRVLEYVDIEMVIEGASARVIREWYTHIAGDPTRLQQSTRYCEWKDDTAIILPDSVKKVIQENEKEYAKYCKGFIDWIDFLKEKNVPKEDIAMFYPLGMETKIVDKRNLRNLIEMFHQRSCTRAYWEYREIMQEIKKKLSELSDEWKLIADNFFVPKCDMVGYCTEKQCCGRRKKLTDNSLKEFLNNMK